MKGPLSETANDDSSLNSGDRIPTFGFFPVLASLMGYALSSSPFSAFAQIQFHELGHALASWWIGAFALPLPWGLTFWGPSHHPLALLCFSGFGMIWILKASQERLPLARLLGVAALLTHYCALICLTDQRADDWRVWGGPLGEISLPVVGLILFFIPVPHKLRWDFWRYPAVVFAMLGVFGQHTAWADFHRSSGLPLGSLLGGRGDLNGDMNRILVMGWTQVELLNRLHQISVIAVAITVTISIVSLLYYFASRKRVKSRY